MSEWSYPNLRISPCRYTGSAYKNNLIIAAHNYESHFGNLKYLNAGDEITFTDVDGNVFNYVVAEIEQLNPTAIEQMESGDWALTLFTCTIGGSYRVTVRCDLAE
jgi:sortase A